MVFLSKTTRVNAENMIFHGKKSSVLLISKHVCCPLSCTDLLSEVQINLHTNGQKNQAHLTSFCVLISSFLVVQIWLISSLLLHALIPQALRRKGPSDMSLNQQISPEFTACKNNVNCAHVLSLCLPCAHLLLAKAS